MAPVREFPASSNMARYVWPVPLAIVRPSIKSRITILNEMTTQQSDFAAHYVTNGGNGAQAAISAGYAEDSARQAAYKLLKLPHVQAAITEQLRRDLSSLAVIGLGRLKTILEDPYTKATVVADAVIKIIDRAGLAPKSGRDTQGDSKPIEQMTIAELEAFIRQREDELCDVAPHPVQSPTLRAIATRP